MWVLLYVCCVHAMVTWFTSNFFSCDGGAQSQYIVFDIRSMVPFLPPWLSGPVLVTTHMCISVVGAPTRVQQTNHFMDVYSTCFCRDCKDNFILVTHGVVWRMLLMRYFKWTVAEYHSLWNPENCQMAILQKGKDGRYALLTPLRRNPSTQEMSKSLWCPPITPLK